MSDKKPIYAPCTCKLIDTSNGQFMKLSFTADKMIQFIKSNTNAKGFVNLNISERREVGQFGDTHSVKLDTWQPSEGKQSNPRPASQKQSNHDQAKANAFVSDDIPF